MTQIVRTSDDAVDVVIANTEDESTSFATAGYAFGKLILPTLTSTSLGFEASEDDSAWETCLDADGVAVAITPGVGCIRIPDSCFPANHLRIKSGIAEGAERTIGTKLST